MIRTTDIHSITEFQRNTKSFIQQVTDTKKPIAITVNGAAQVVVQDATAYQAMVDEIERARLMEALAEGERAAAEGRTIELSQAEAALRAKHGLHR